MHPYPARVRQIPWVRPVARRHAARSLLFALVCALVFLVTPPAAHADDPVDLDGAYVVDTVGAISGREDDVQAALDDLYEETGVQLFVVYVDSFEGVADDESWAVATSDRNGLGNDDILLAVATGDRNYDFRYPAALELEIDATNAVEDDVLGSLRNDDWAGTAIVAADGYRDAADGAGIRWPLIVGGVVVVGGILLWVIISRKRAKISDTTGTAGRLDQKQLDLRVGSVLVQLDDSIKASEQELGFAVAQFGDDASKPFVAVLESAKAKVSEAFQLKQQLDDAVPETPEQKRAVSLRIVELCGAADAELDDQADDFDELRALEKTAPEALAAVRADAHALSPKLEAAATTVEELNRRYSPAALTTVADNREQATKLLQFAASATTAAEAALAEGNPSAAAVAVRTAQASVGQATELLTAIDTLADRLADAMMKLDAAIADTRQDLASAKALQENASSSALAPLIAAAEAAISAAMEGSDAGDPVARLDRITEANAELERVFGATRDAQLQVERARVALEGTLATARSQIAAAHDYIDTRRGGIGEVPRTRVAEASRHLDSAVTLAASDPVAALSAAQQAASLARSAVTSAQNDVNAYQSGSSGQYGNYGGQGYGVGSNEADLGGLLGMLLGGGNRGGGYWGGRGSSSGWSWGGSSGGRNPRSGSAGSFGGSSRSRSSSRSSRSSSRSRSSRGRF